MSDRRIHNHHDHDDGLVHGHDWARAERAAPASSGPAALPAPGQPRQAVHAARPVEIDHDDGLVHDHAWARGERMSGYAAQ